MRMGSLAQQCKRTHFLCLNTDMGCLSCKEYQWFSIVKRCGGGVRFCVIPVVLTMLMSSPSLPRPALAADAPDTWNCGTGWTVQTCSMKYPGVTANCWIEWGQSVDDPQWRIGCRRIESPDPDPDPTASYTGILEFDKNVGETGDTVTNMPTRQQNTFTTSGGGWIEIPSNEPVRKGYEFQGWAKTSGSSRIDYSPNESVPFDFSDGTKSKTITLYAVWAMPSTYTLTFDLNGAPGEPPATQTLEAHIPTTKPADPVWPGHRFDGWYTLSGSEFAFGSVLTSDRVVQAHWTAIAATAMPETGVEHPTIFTITGVIFTMLGVGLAGRRRTV